VEWRLNAQLHTSPMSSIARSSKVALLCIVHSMEQSASEYYDPWDVYEEKREHQHAHS
jgi:hypothetical protein